MNGGYASKKMIVLPITNNARPHVTILRRPKFHVGVKKIRGAHFSLLFLKVAEQIQNTKMKQHSNSPSNKILAAHSD